MSELSLRFWGAFFCCSVICVLFWVISQTRSSTQHAPSASDEFRRFQVLYVAVYLLAMFADWLQGPYVYQLYTSYGYSEQQIAQLFVCGFLSSMTFGTVVAALADKCGRKRMCMTYSILYIIACLTKLYNNYWVLMAGRLFSGVATSLLFAVFESWMVCEHARRGFDPKLLSKTFGYATLGNGLSAILAGLIANLVSNSFGYVAPFIVAIVPLALLGVIVGLIWEENYGDEHTLFVSSLRRAIDVVRNDRKVVALGSAQALYEGAMYCFVLIWTPALSETREGESTAHFLGLIFSAYMVCVMTGSACFQWLTTRADNMFDIFPIAFHILASVSMLASAAALDNKLLVFVCFLLFETTVGMFYPSYGRIKSAVIPEEVRAAVMTLFRVPLNALVVVMLLKIEDLSMEIVLIICAAAHLIACLAYGEYYRQGPGQKFRTIYGLLVNDSERESDLELKSNA